MKKEQLQTIREALCLAQEFLYNDLDAICDNDYLQETEDVISRIQNAISIIDEVQSKQNSL